MSRTILSVVEPPTEGFRETLPERTKRIYDRLSVVYPVSTMLFHSRAHDEALHMAGLHDGMRILEVATGSGEMFKRLVRLNRNGFTIGIDLSPRMAALTQERARRRHPQARVHCQAVDARFMPFRDKSFDALICCYLLELLSEEDIVRTLAEFHRVLRLRGLLVLTMIGQNAELFNRAYEICGRLAPAFWGRQVEESTPYYLEQAGFRVRAQKLVRQNFYPSTILLATA